MSDRMREWYGSPCYFRSRCPSLLWKYGIGIRYKRWSVKKKLAELEGETDD